VGVGVGSAVSVGGGGSAVGASVGCSGAGAIAVSVAFTLASTSPWSIVGGGASVGLLQAANKNTNSKAIMGTVFLITNLLLNFNLGELYSILLESKILIFYSNNPSNQFASMFSMVIKNEEVDLAREAGCIVKINQRRFILRL
jgi:hypothetical protein